MVAPIVFAKWRLALIIAVAAVAGLASVARETATVAATVPAGTIVGVAVSDGGPDGFALRPTHLEAGGQRRDWNGPRLWVRSAAEVEVGQRLVVAGAAGSDGFRTRYGPVAGAIAAARVTVIEDPGLLLAAGSALRNRVRQVFAESGPGPALVTGFLIGDTEGVPPRDVELLRLSGLSHFVAVSGSNVALVVGGWWIVAGLFITDGRWRAIGALGVLVVFVIATRWEPSVVRAAVMAALILGGRVVGRSVAAWTALGGAVAGIVVVSPELTANIGFQLSVAATAGVLLASPVGGGKWLATTAAATIGAQAVVAPLLLFHFGSVPLLAPVANILAAPLVTAATSIGAVAVVVPWLVPIAGGFADGVTTVAATFAAGPQLGLVELLSLGVATPVLARAPLRPLGMAALAAVAISAIPDDRQPAEARAVFLDVGQGDSLLLQGEATVLIDGGPDPAALREALHRHNVRRIDLAIVSHPHADHITGLRAALDAVPVGALWYPPHFDGNEALEDLLAQATTAGIPAITPPLGSTAHVGLLRLEVLGPRRRYAGTNNGSLVVAVTAGGVRLLATGDIETVAQQELDPGHVDILKVPHQGAATSDLGWLEDNSGSIAVISVGPNSFGHPSPESIAALRAGGATVLRTDRAGDITLSLLQVPLPP